MSRVQVRRKKKKQRRILRLAILAAVLTAIIAAIIIILHTESTEMLPQETDIPQNTEVPAANKQEESINKLAFPFGQDTADLKLGISKQQTAVADEKRVDGRPAVQGDGWLPIFRKAVTNEKIIAITVDDCSQAANLKAIIDIALAYGQKLTILPIGENIEKAAVGQALIYAYQNGFELENHTYTHNPLYSCSDEELAWEVSMQNYALCKLLGVNYQCHFLRPKGGDARADQRIHTYIDQLGYYGIAHWAVSGTQSIKGIVESLAPGNIYLFHTTDKDLERLKQFIPYAVEQGYALVTLNEMFGYPENETSEFVEMTAPLPLREYTTVYVPLQKSNHSYLTKLLQDRLFEMGYLDAAGDGIFGENTQKAVMAYQQEMGLKADGIAGEQVLSLIFADSAAVSGEG